MITRIKACWRRSVIALLMLAATALAGVSDARAECKEYNVVEFEDRVEVVCVGEPLTAAQKQALAEEERRQELEYKRQQAAEERRQKEAENERTRKQAQAEVERKKQEVKQNPIAKKIGTKNINVK